MNTEVFIQNVTSQNFELKDIDGNIFGQILAGRSYSLKLTFSSTFEKQYNFVFPSQVMSFWLNINGEIVRVQNNNQPYTLIVEFENCPVKFFNKIIIAPQNGVFLKGCSSLNLKGKPLPNTPPQFVVIPGSTKQTMPQGSIFTDITRLF